MNLYKSGNTLNVPSPSLTNKSPPPEPIDMNSPTPVNIIQNSPKGDEGHRVRGFSVSEPSFLFGDKELGSPVQPPVTPTNNNDSVF